MAEEPLYPDELLLGLDALQAETLQECIVLEVDCCLPQLRDIPSQYDSAGELVRHAIDFGYIPLDVAPWEYTLLLQRTLERQKQRGDANDESAEKRAVPQ